jgi:hypothetical protein
MCRQEVDDMKTVRISEATHRQLLFTKTTLERDREQLCSFDEVIAFLLEAAAEATSEGLVRTA